MSTQKANPVTTIRSHFVPVLLTNSTHSYRHKIIHCVKQWNAIAFSNRRPNVNGINGRNENLWFNIKIYFVQVKALKMFHDIRADMRAIYAGMHVAHLSFDCKIVVAFSVCMWCMVHCFVDVKMF